MQFKMQLLTSNFILLSYLLSPINSPVTLHSSQLTRNRMCSQDSGVPKTLQSFILSAPFLFVLVLFYSVKH